MNSRAFVRGAVAAALLPALAGASVRQPAAPAAPAAHVFVVMLDGTRPDVLRRARTPTLQALAASGATYLQAETVYPSQTRVAFVTLPTGAFPGSHGIVGGNDFKDAAWNTVAMGDEDPIAAQALVARPTFFEDAAEHGLTSLYAATKGYELVGARGATWTVNGKKTIDREAWDARYQPEADGSPEKAAWLKQSIGRQVLEEALRVVRERRPNLAVINLAAADYAGHSFGPDSPYYQRAVEYQDALLGELVRAAEALAPGRVAFVISADHGFSAVDRTRVVAESARGHQLAALQAAGIENHVVNTGGASAGVYVRDKSRLAEAALLLRREPWCEAVFCEDRRGGCERTLSELRAFFPGRSPDFMVELDDDATLEFPNAGQHGSRRPSDMRIPLVLSGAGVARGFVGGKASLTDVAPTVLHLLGVLPRRLRPDGRVLTEALAP